MFGYSRTMPDDVSLPGPSGTCFRGCERPNAGRQVRRWQPSEARRTTARHTHEKRARFEAAPAASPARHVGRRLDRNARFMALVREIFYYRVKRLYIYASDLLPLPLCSDTHYPSNVTRSRARFLPIVWKYSLVTPFATGCFVIANTVCSLFANCTPSMTCHSVAIFAIFFHEH